MSGSKYYEYIVIGIGGVGSAALYWLSNKAGHHSSVLGLEQFKLGHENGGSQDVSRVIRHGYDDMRYTNLTRAMFEAWDVVQEESGIQLVYNTGVVDFAHKNSERALMLEEYADTMTKVGLDFERWDGEEMQRRFPQFNTGDKDITAIYQKDGGIVDAAMGNAVHVQLARAHGATVIDECPVTRLEPVADGCIVHTPRGSFRCRRVIVTPGAWINHVLSTVGVHIPVKITQEQVTYYATPHIKKFTKESIPAFSYIDDQLNFYGLPIHGNTGIKAGIDAGGPVVLPETRTFTADPVRERACYNFLKTFVPDALGPVLFTKTCLYAMTYDRHFLVDSLQEKELPQVFVCLGAGHIYKFASLMGKILSELAVDGRTQHDISGFKYNREPITNPDYKPNFQITYDPSKSRL